MAVSQQKIDPSKNVTRVLESICKERRKETMDKVSDGGFVVLAIESFWTRLFSQYFIYKHDDSRDDLLFYVKSAAPSKRGKDSSKSEAQILVFRKDTKNLPSLGDPDIDWEETVYLNLILHQFEYTLTCAVCTKPHEKELRILRRISQQVYATPSRRRMDSKGETTEISYPNIFFVIDDFEETFKDFTVKDNEMVCVELVARDKTESFKGVVFLGSIRFESLKKVYENRASMATKVAQKMSMGWWKGQSTVEFIKMKGPSGKGHAEMAISRHKDCTTPDCYCSICTECGGREDCVGSSDTDMPCQCTTDDSCDWSHSQQVSSKKKKGSTATSSVQRTKLRRRSLGSSILSAYLTYVTLPWNKIIKDILEVRQQPILT
ncbi:uncharacterized protein KIAA0930 homolog isoform X2 [Nematostella vectensis]|uniref:uncharacterized protein KIAA0930 homolog isoform X2 n=1 Tax=Nematostella vectensis TaxID=45351 RepID=UPI00138FABBA|nr:uncharacterized protein KIAA0930 homolog isoform X2 [Nematostella vectensis]